MRLDKKVQCNKKGEVNLNIPQKTENKQNESVLEECILNTKRRAAE